MATKNLGFSDDWSAGSTRKNTGLSKGEWSKMGTLTINSNDLAQVPDNSVIKGISLIGKCQTNMPAREVEIKAELLGNTAYSGHQSSYGDEWGVTTNSFGGCSCSDLKNNPNIDVYCTKHDSIPGTSCTYNPSYVVITYTYYLDVNGQLDSGVAQGSISPMGVMDAVTSVDSRLNDTDYYNSELEPGTTYTVNNIRANDGYFYVGEKSFSGSLSQSLTIVLPFITVYPYTINFDGNGNTNEFSATAGTSRIGDNYTIPQNPGFKKEYTITFDFNVPGVANQTAVSSATIEGWEDWGTITAPNGTQFAPEQFDAPYYANKYSDLKNKYGYNKRDLINHYVTNGLSEGRSCIPDAGESRSVYPIGATGVSLADNGGSTTLKAQWSDMPSVSLIDAERDRYEFLGWYTEQDGGDRVGGHGDTYTPQENIRLYAHWKRIDYIITYNGNGATEGVNFSQSVPAGDSIKLASNKFAKKSHTQLIDVGIDTQEIGGLPVGTKIKTPTVSGEYSRYTISEKQEDGEYSICTLQSETSLSYTLMAFSELVTKITDSEGYYIAIQDMVCEADFWGWSISDTTSSLKDVMYVGSQFTPQEDITLYATWGVLQAETSLPLRYKKGYDFEGWFINDVTANVYAPGSNFVNNNTNKVVRLYAKWKPINRILLGDKYVSGLFRGTTPIYQINKGTDIVYRKKCNHQFESTKNITNPTCTKPGVGCRVCSECKELHSVVVPAYGHNFSTEMTVLYDYESCTGLNIAYYKCSRCSEKKDLRPVHSLGHTDDNNDGVCDKCGAQIGYLRDVRIGSVVKFGRYEDGSSNIAELEWVVVDRDYDPTSSEAKWVTLQSLYVLPGMEINPSTGVKYSETSIDRWLNSDLGANQWYTPSAGTLKRPSYESWPCFLNKFTDNEKAAIINTTFASSVIEDSLYITTEQITRKVFLPSCGEIGVVHHYASNAPTLGANWFYYTSADQRVGKSISDKKTAYAWLLRDQMDTMYYLRVTPDKTGSNGVNITHIASNYNTGIRPCINISGGQEISSFKDSDGCYTLIYE